MPGRERGPVWGWMAAAVLLPCAVASCESPAGESQNPPDAVLRDSLGLTEADRVHRVNLGVEAGSFTVEPVRLEVPRGVWVEFAALDGWPRTVTFEVDSLPEAAVELLRSTGQDASPPLLDPGARFLVHFAGAPEGRYPYVVEGSAGETRGAVVVVGTGAGAG